MILLRAQGGLCNRLRAINAAYCLSQDTGHRLKVYWNKNVEMNADFHSIFEDPQQYFTVSDVGQENFFLHLFFSPRNFINRIPKVKKGADISEVLNILKKKHNKIWTISAFLEFYRPRTPDYSWLRPKQTILEEINRNLISMGNTSIGLHVRRTDNKMAIKRSPLYLFIDKS